MPQNTLNTSQSIESVRKKMIGVSALLASLQVNHKWPSAEYLQEALTQTTNNLQEHYDKLTPQAFCLLECDDNPAEDVADLFRRWHIEQNPPSMLALCLFFLNENKVMLQPDDLATLMTAGVLGQVRNDVPYHSDMHFRKVLAQTMRLISCNNVIFEGTPRALNARQICLLLTAACIHDLGHDGQGNFVKGIHIEGRAEKISFDYAKPYLAAAGCSDATLEKLRVMLLTTDVSPLDDPANPMMQMKAAYRFHFMGENTRAHTLNLSKDISILEKDEALSAMCLLLHEADIATSAGVTYEVTKFETSLLMQEFKEDKAYPTQVINFLNQICQHRFLSDAGQKLFAANLARIYALAEKDVKSGDEPYPPPEHADFVILHMSNADGNKTIN